MLDLIGNNLGERQKDLNKKVLEAFRTNESFEQVKNIEENSDVDKLFKIDLAILYENFNYIVDILKCGDSLYISRALKCTSLYRNSALTDPDFLHENIFPFMSIKMKKKMITAISQHIQEQERIDSFYKYCVKNHLLLLSYKFLINASVVLKEEFIEHNLNIHNMVYFKNFFGDSYDLIEKYINKIKLVNGNLDNVVHSFRYLYSHSKEKFLDLLEHYLKPKNNFNRYLRNKFSVQMSKDILVKHKARVLNKICLYLPMLDEKTVSKYSTCEDAKKYAVAFLPEKSEEFWSINFCRSYNYFIKIIPASDLYSFLKEIFQYKYPNKLFEMNIKFYEFKYHELMTDYERHKWALQHIDEKKEHFGPLRDYEWYKFVIFDIAFKEIKRLIFLNSSSEIRSSLLDVLIKSASTQKDLEILLSYYYERHVNEQQQYKERFVDSITKHHNLFNFDEKCWAVFNKILHSLNVFTTSQNTDRYTVLPVIYNIIKYGSVPEFLEPFCYFKNRSHLFNTCLEKLSVEQQEFLYQFLMNYFLKKIEILKCETMSDDYNKQILLLTWSVVSVVVGFRKGQASCPKIIIDIMKVHEKEFCEYRYWFIKTQEYINRREKTEGELLRLLKKDKELLIDIFHNKQCKPTRHNRFTNLLHKIKIYFPYDLNERLVTLLREQLLECQKENEYDQVVILCLFRLADDKFINGFLEDYKPTTPKIDYVNIDRKVLGIQKGICRFAHYSRPLVPYMRLRPYVQGGYVSFCLHIFNSYLVNLPWPQSIEFVKTVIDSPLSVQKHGLRLAFKSYNSYDLKDIVLKVWSDTKNVSLRLIIYKALVQKIKDVQESDQIILYEALKMFTLSLHVNDQDEIYELLVSSNLPRTIYGDFLRTVWTVVSRFPEDSSSYINKKTTVIKHIADYRNMLLVGRDFCIEKIIEDHINTMFLKGHIIEHSNTYNVRNLYNEKWQLIATYITCFDNDKDLENSIKLVNQILKLCLNMWNEVYNGKYVIREFLYNYLKLLKSNIIYEYDCSQKPYIIPVYNCIVDFLQKNLPINIMLIWDFKLEIICRHTIGNGPYEAAKNVATEELAKNLAKGFAQIVMDDNYPSLIADFAKLIKNNINIMIRFTKLKYEQIIVAVCHNLIGYTQSEIHLLAAHMLPLHSDGYKSEIDEVIDKILALGNNDLKVFVYNKFVCCDHKNRLCTRM